MYTRTIPELNSMLQNISNFALSIILSRSLFLYCEYISVYMVSSFCKLNIKGNFYQLFFSNSVLWHR